MSFRYRVKEGSKKKASSSSPAAASSSSPASASSSSSSGVVDVASLVSLAEACVDAANLSEAAGLYERALSMAPRDTNIMDSLGEVYLNLGDSDRSLFHFRRSSSLAPLAGHGKWLYLGGLLEGKEAADAFLKGIEVLSGLLSATGGSAAGGGGESVETMKRELSDAYVSLVELHMTDLCDEEGAEEACGGYAEAAMAADPTAPTPCAIMRP